MSNILHAILNITANPVTELNTKYIGRNTINTMGEALETYVKDIFADTLSETDDLVRQRIYSDIFSHEGTQNHPPDIILKASDAIEVKKIQGYGNSVPLNSSHPKNKLYADDIRITKACRECEDDDWVEKDIIYAVGVTDDENIKQLSLVYGDCYAANKDKYDRIRNIIETGVNDIENVDFSETKELARINKVDPLGLTNLRVRGVWEIVNPLILYGDIFELDRSKRLSVVCLMRENKFMSFDSVDQYEIINNPAIEIDCVDIRDPDKPEDLINTILIKMVVA